MNKNELKVSAELKKRFSANRTAPYLFVGSGLSIRYAGLDSWEQLLKRFAVKTPRSFADYRSASDGDYPKIGSEIAGTFRDVWFSSQEYKESRADYEDRCVSRASPLKYEVARYIIENSSADEVQEAKISEEISALSKAQVDGVITTNYDPLLEQAFPDFRVFIGQEDILFSDPHGIGEIYKIHGCCTRPESIVLTGEDYQHFERRNAYLAAKLLSVFVEHPIVFIGYSMGDSNVLSILNSIALCLSRQNLDRLRDQLIFVEWTAEKGVCDLSSTTLMAIERNVPVLQLKTNSFLPVFNALGEVRRQLPARVLRLLRERVYNLVVTSTGRETVFVRNIDDHVDSEQIDVVLGVGVLEELGATGYRGLEREDLFRDLIWGDRPYDPQLIVSDCLPRLLKNATYVPVLKYLRKAEYFDSEGELLDEDLKESVRKAAKKRLRDLGPPNQYAKKRDEIRTKYESFHAMVRDRSPDEVVMYAGLLERGAFDIDNIRLFLQENWKKLYERGNGLAKTQYIKLVCILDYLEHEKSKA